MIVLVVFWFVFVVLYKVVVGGIVVFFVFFIMWEVIRVVEFVVWYELIRKVFILIVCCWVIVGWMVFWSVVFVICI